MTTIYLIRHGQASIGASNYDVLSPLGRQQSSILGTYLNKTQVHFDKVFSGTLQRQIDTASISLNMATDAFTHHATFNEYHHNSIFNHYASIMARHDRHIADALADGHNTKMTFDTFAGLMNAWVNDPEPPADLESWDQFKERILSGLQSVITEHSDAKNIAIYTSGGVICTIIQWIMQFQAGKLFELNWGIYNASVSTLKTHHSGVKLIKYNCIAHLDLENDSSLISNI